MQNILTLIEVCKSSPELSEKSLSAIVSTHYHPDLLTDPKVITEELIRNKKLIETIDDLRAMISIDPMIENSLPVDLSASFGSMKSGQFKLQRRLSSDQHGQSDDRFGASGRFGQSSHFNPEQRENEGKRLLLHYQKLLRLVKPASGVNYLKGLFYHVRRVSRTLNECRDRSKSYGSKDHPHKDEVPFTAHGINRGSYFSVLYQSPSAVLCQMVLKENVPPNVVDDLANEMKVDLLGTLCSVLCPNIQLSSAGKKGIKSSSDRRSSVRDSETVVTRMDTNDDVSSRLLDNDARTINTGTMDMDHECENDDGLDFGVIDTCYARHCVN